MFKHSIQTLAQFSFILSELAEDSYTKLCNTISDATIGQHTRHIIELYQCLIWGYDVAEVNYDQRKRNKQIEQDVNFAMNQIEIIIANLQKEDKKLIVSYELGESEVKLESTYFREVMYNLEHTIHHQAIIKIAINQFTNIKLPNSFGVAPSTMQYRKECVQ